MKSPIRTAAVRALFYFAIWVVLMPSAKLDDLAVGMVATIAATWASMHLLPPAAGRLRVGALLIYLPRFLWQSLLAGVDVARRAFDPRLPLRPGFVVYRTGFPPGRARNEFASITSLLPGSVPVDEEPDAIVYHCLDTSQPVAEQTAAEEQALTRVLVAGERYA